MSRLRLDSTLSLPGNWSSIGCYSDNVQGHTLTEVSYVDTANMTVENCVGFCGGQYFVFAGLEYSQECYCGDHIANGGAKRQFPTVVFLVPVILQKFMALAIDLACTGPVNHLPLLQKLSQASPSVGLWEQ